ncbi:unnamed protein product [Sphagnum balticum]
MTQPKVKRTTSVVGRVPKSFGFQDISIKVHFNNTCDVESLKKGHRKRKSGLSLTMGSKQERISEWEGLGEILGRAEGVLEQYKNRCSILEKENRRYKKKCSQTLKRLKNLESKV